MPEACTTLSRSSFQASSCLRQSLRIVFCKSGLHHLTKPRVLLTRPSHMTQLFLKRIQGGSDDVPLKSGW